MARYKFTENDFQQLKYFFDQNDLYGGASWLTQMMDNWLEEYFTESYSGEILYNLPFHASEGVTFEQPSTLNNVDPNSYHDKPEIGLTEEVLQTLELVHKLNERIQELEKMHTEDGKHIPTIISTKEQYEEMKPHMNEKDRVLVHTTFDQAMNVL